MKQISSKIISLLSFAFFIICFGALQWFGGHANSELKNGYPIFAAVTALCFAWFSFSKDTSKEKRFDLLYQGAGQPLIIQMCFIFLLSTIFSYSLTRIGSLQALVSTCLHYMPTHYILPGIFCITSLFSFMIGSSMGAIATCVPFALPLGNSIGASPALTAGTVVCGAMFGDNLSLLSDTTIAAVQVTKSNMRKKLQTNLLVALPAFILSIILLTLHTTSSTAVHSTVLTSSTIILLSPYILTITLALIGIDIMLVLFAGIHSTLLLGLFLQKIHILEYCGIWFSSIQANPDIIVVMLLVMLIGILAHILQYHKSLEWILYKVEKWRIAPRWLIFSLVSLVNSILGINTISILITGPIAQQIGTANTIKPHTTATILDLGACITQGILPYTPQLLLAASLAKISSFHMLPYLYYQYALLGTVILFIIGGEKRSNVIKMSYTKS